MPSKMTPEQLAGAKASANVQNSVHQLATMANGHGVSRTEARKAEKTLVTVFGTKKTKKFKEQALQRAGAKPKGLGRLFG